MGLKPEAIVRGPSFSPMSISSQYNFSASGCSQHFVTVPTRMSSKGAACSQASSGEDGSGMDGAGGALAGFGAFGFFSFFFSAGGALGFSGCLGGGGLALGVLALVAAASGPAT